MQCKETMAVATHLCALPPAAFSSPAVLTGGRPEWRLAALGHSEQKKQSTAEATIHCLASHQAHGLPLQTQQPLCRGAGTLVGGEQLDQVHIPRLTALARSQLQPNSGRQLLEAWSRTY